jgi:V/A-type H+/Na+-transporting ATPase subunit D
MIDLDQLQPTRAVLLELRQELEQTIQGHAILERKRETLLRELWNLVSEVKHNEKEIRSCFARAYQVQREARLLMGATAMDFAALAPAANTESSVDIRAVMGVPLPLVRLQVTPLPFPYSPVGINPIFDELRNRWIEVGRKLATWTEMSGSAWRIATELERTQRRVRALETLLIPKYRAAIERIQALLDEQERDSFMRAKRAKEQRER